MVGAWSNFKIIGGVALGGIIAVIFSIVSHLRKEPSSGLSLFFAIPAIMLLGYLGLAQLEANRDREKEIVQNEVMEDFGQQIKKDPEIVFGIDWKKERGSRVFIFTQSFSDPTVPYTREQLKRLWDTVPELRDSLLAHPAWDSAFIESQFENAWRRCVSGENFTMLASISSNANTPRHLLEKVASAKDIPVGAVNPARATLKKLEASNK